mmetsp:Transcript_54706/g.132834  ORF Transcript_54706/g.132834 Transcript_54706/m.132834 type:complete len:137 (+) Transcript_54706:934-1344(+)
MMTVPYETKQRNDNEGDVLLNKNSLVIRDCELHLSFLSCSPTNSFIFILLKLLRQSSMQIRCDFHSLRTIIELTHNGDRIEKGIAACAPLPFSIATNINGTAGGMERMHARTHACVHARHVQHLLPSAALHLPPNS